MVDLGSDKGGFKKAPDGTLIPNESVQSKLNESQIAARKGPALTQAQQQQAINLVKNFASGGATFGQTVAGFKSLSEEVKPQLEEIAEDVRKRVDPVISEMQSNVPGITVNSKPATKANVDALAGKSTATEKKLRKVISGGNPKAINKVLRDELKAAEPAIKQATNEASDAINNPQVQEQLKSVGFTETDLGEFNNLLKGQGVNSLMQNIETEKVAEGLSQSSQLQMKSLGNPFGFDIGAIAQGITPKSPTGVSVPSLDVPQVNTPGFGPKGLPFGNILGSVVGSITNVGSFQGIGNPLDTLPGGINPADGLPVPPIVDLSGNTNLSKVVNKGNKLTDVTEPTTDILDVSTSSGRRPVFVSDLEYKKVNGAKELELELASLTDLRTPETLVISWVGASGSDDNWTGKEWNDFFVKKRLQHGLISGDRLKYNIVTLDKAWQANYFIRKDGTIERMLPADMIPYNGRTVGGETFLTKLIFTLDAGLTIPRTEGGGQSAFLSADSITAEQWRSLDMVLKVFFRLPKAREAIGLEELGGDTRYGPGFDVGEYVKKFRRQSSHKSTTSDTPAAEAEVNATPENPTIAFDKDKRQYAVNVDGTIQNFSTEQEAEPVAPAPKPASPPPPPEEPSKYPMRFPNGNKVTESTLNYNEWVVLFLRGPKGGSTRRFYNDEQKAIKAAETDDVFF